MNKAVAVAPPLDFKPPINPGDSLKRVLIIKLGALGDFIQCLGACKIVREVHRSAHITLLTTPPFAKFAEACPYFNVVEADGRDKDMKSQAAMTKRVRAAGYDMVYDFQNNGRTERYFKAFNATRWSGAAKGASHQHNNPDRAAMHNFDRLGEQLYHAGIGPNGIVDPQPWPLGRGPLPDLTWIKPAFRHPPHLEPAYFSLYERYALIIPGSSPEHPEKRWPVACFTEICKRLVKEGVTPVIIGGKAEGEIGQTIAKACPDAKNLVTRTDLFQLVTLAGDALFTIGGDTGPMHMAAATRRPGVCLFAQDWTPEMETELKTVWNPQTRLGRAAPKGGNIIVNSASRLDMLSADDVWRSIKALGVL